DRLKAAGDPRGRGQIMADTLVERLTGQATADATPVEVALLVPEDTLLAGGDEPAEMVGHGPIPAPAARDLIRDTRAQVWLRRIVTRPADGALTAMESRRRTFPEGLRRLLVYRDQYCRTPWCGAPIRHADHVRPAEDGGPTSAGNGQGLCEACNHTKQAPDWRARPGPAGAGHTVQVTTPTGHTYTSRPPPPPGRLRTTPEPSTLEAHLRQFLDAA
ncbi:MAG: HNH endonuclease, partial [Actinomycetes bacterium]